MEKGYKKLIVWQKSDQMARSVYHVSQKFPKIEIFGLTSQLRRAALSVPTNIVEGVARQTKKETSRFINIALGSLAETEYLLEFSNTLNYLNKKEYNELENLRSEVGRLLWRFYQSFGH